MFLLLAASPPPLLLPLPLLLAYLGLGGWHAVVANHGVGEAQKLSLVGGIWGATSKQG